MDKVSLEIYRLEVSTNTFTKIETIKNYRTLSWAEKVNSVGACSFILDIYNPRSIVENLLRLRNHVVVKVNDIIVWVGFVNRVSGSLQDVNGYLQVECLGQMGHLRYKFTDDIVTYSDEDAGDIAWDLIDTVQSRTNGGIGLCEGTIEVTKDRDRTYQYYEVLQAINNLTNVIDGFDYHLTYGVDSDGDLEEVYFNVSQSLGTKRENIMPLKIGVNVRKVFFNTKEQIINTVTGLGSGTGDGILTSSDEDSPSQLSYSRSEYILARKDISVQTTLDGHTENFVNSHKAERYDLYLDLIPETLPTYGQINLGDSVRIELVTSQDSYIDFRGFARIYEIGTSVDETGGIHRNLKLVYYT